MLSGEILFIVMLSVVVPEHSFNKSQAVAKMDLFIVKAFDDICKKVMLLLVM
jgi:hypothetical protein